MGKGKFKEKTVLIVISGKLAVTLTPYDADLGLHKTPHV